MTREEHLLTCAMEEAVEVAQRICKTLRFGLLEVQPGQELSNRMRIRQELTDLLAVLEMIDANIVQIHPDDIDAKKVKVEHYLAYSRECGR